jgi:hypothetical protein
MKKIYKFITAGVLFITSTASSQCIQPTQYPSGTVTIANTGTTTVTTCNFGGEYSVNSFTATGSYVFNGTGGVGNFLTITDNLNVPLASGYAPLGFVIPSVGLYRIHVSTNNLCGTDGSCHTISVSSDVFCASTAQYPSGTINVLNPGTTTVTTCNFGGEYSVNSFSATGIYTITATGGTGNYLTIKNTAGTVVYASGVSPVSFNATTVGLYRIHIATTAPPACGTDVTCHEVTIASGTTAVIVAPANDVCSSAITLAIPSTTAGTTVNATLESPAPPTCSTTLSQPGVWYKVVGNGNAFGADLCTTSTWDSKIFVYTGVCGTWSCVTGNDDNGPLCSGASASATWCSVPATDYYILVTGYSSASAFDIALTQTVVSQPTVVVTASSSSLCAGSSSTLTAGGASTYSWTSIASTASIVVTPSTTSVYTVTGTSTVACTTPNVKTFTITVNPIPTVSVTSGAICSGTSYTIIPSGASTYTYSSGSAVVTPTTNSSYSITGTSSLGCASSNTAVSSVTVNALPSVSVNSGAICSGNSFTMIATGSGSVSYSSGSPIVNPGSSTDYTVTLTNTITTCSNTAISSVTVNANPLVSSSTSNSLICLGESAVLTASTSATSYTWNTGSTTMSVSVSPTVTSTYTVNVSNAAACVSSSTVMVTVNACVGINEAIASLISVYPNPNNGILNINLTAELAKNASLEIYDALGKLVVKHSLENELNTLNISTLTNGVYIFKVLNNSSLAKIGKLVKQ